MKNLLVNLIILITAAFALVGCMPDGSNYTRVVVNQNLTSWNLPDEATLSVPFNLTLSSCTANGCYSDIQFRVLFENGKNYVYAQSIYENSGEECSLLTACKDSTLSITIDQTGKTYYYFLSENEWIKDSINIVVP